ncbi:MAG: sigma-54 dependent transcriptional regulator [Porphyromonas sp.]|nr:sigma-54 dependent transcriptional regulator [Porphyromonas sp.]
MEKTDILIVDDDSGIRSSLSLLLKRAGYTVFTAEAPRTALSWLEAHSPSLILMDMNFSLSTSGDEGLFLLSQVKKRREDIPVILMTAWGSIELAVKGMQAGAFDFVTKPWDNYKLLDSVRNALELNKPEEHHEEISTRQQLDKSYSFDHIIGQSPAIIEVLQTVARIAPTTASVLITGESGTGKELIAEAIHLNSKRKSAPFVKVNLGGISASLFESEMFGHKKGAFTDAVASRTGRFSLADKGTIFLDEIGELDLASQVKLLRVLQDQTFEVLGESSPTKVDIRVVSATNADLASMVAAGTFREDLYYRINLIVLRVPPLRERREDIPLLARHFARRLCETNGLPAVSFTPEAEAFLSSLHYSGNVRELKNLIERSILISGKSVLEKEDIHYQEEQGSHDTQHSSAQTLEEIEAETIKQKISEYNGNLSRVAKALGISRGALYRRLDRYGIKY